MEMKFNAFIVGAQKSASSSVHFTLLHHPDVCGLNDELTCFESPHYERNEIEKAMGSVLKVRSQEALLLFKRPNLLCLPGAAERISEYNDNAKIIIILRDPAYRAVSAVLHSMKVGLCPVADLDDTISKTFRAAENELTDHDIFIREQGCYGKYLDNWYENFPSKQIRVILQEDLKQDNEWLSDLCHFLAIRPDIDAPSLSATKAKTAIRSYKRMQFHSFLSRSLRTHHNFEYGTSDSSWRKPQMISRGLCSAANMLDQIVLKRIFSDSENLLVSDYTLDLLRDFYRDDILRCQEIISRDLSTWMGSS